MNIFKYLKEIGIDIPNIYYGIDSLPIDVINLIFHHNSKPLVEYFQTEYQKNIVDMDSYIDYLFLMEFTNKENFNFLNIQYQQTINDIQETLSQVKKETPIGTVIKFISENIEVILFNEENIHFTGRETMNIITSYQNGISTPAILFVTEKYPYLIFDNYDKLQKRIEKEDVLLEKLLSLNITIENYFIYFKHIRSIIKSIRERKLERLYKYTENPMASIISFGKDISSVINKENVTQYDIFIREIYEFLVNIHHVEANQFKDYMGKIQSLIDEYIITNGHKSKYELPVGEIVNSLSNQKIEDRLFRLTHNLSEQSKFDSSKLAAHCEEHRLIDIFSANIPTDTYFTLTHQRRLKRTLIMNSAILFELCRSKEKLTETKDCYLLYAETLDNHFGEKDLVYDMEDIFSSIESIIPQFPSEIPPVNTVECYGVSMFLCAVAEKILRKTYFQISRFDKYVNLDKITLGQLLNASDITMNNVFGANHRKNLLFYLGENPETGIGMNYRNKLAHLARISKDEINITLVFSMLYVLTDILNTSLFYFKNN